MNKQELKEAARSKTFYKKRPYEVGFDAGFAANAKLIEDAIELLTDLNEVNDEEIVETAIIDLCDRLRQAIEPEGEKV